MERGGGQEATCERKKPERRDDQLSDAGRTVDRSVMSRGLAFGIAGRWQNSIPIIRSSVSSDV